LSVSLWSFPSDESRESGEIRIITFASPVKILNLACSLFEYAFTCALSCEAVGELSRIKVGDEFSSDEIWTKFPSANSPNPATSSPIWIPRLRKEHHHKAKVLSHSIMEGIRKPGLS